MRTKEFKGVRLSVEDHQSLLVIQSEMRRWDQSDIEFALTSDPSGFYKGQLLFMARSPKVWLVQYLELWHANDCESVLFAIILCRLSSCSTVYFCMNLPQE